MSDFGNLRRYVRLPGRRAARIRSDVDDEIRLHLEMRVAELQEQGFGEEAARVEAMRQFGDLEDARRYCYAMDAGRERGEGRAHWWSAVRQDAVHAVRQMRRSAAFTLGAIATLAIGIAASTAVYSAMDAYLLRALPYPNADRLTAIIAGPSREPFPNAPSLAAVDWTFADSIFAATAAWDLDGFTIADGDHPEYVEGAWVSAGYFRALGIRPQLGREFRPEEYASAAPVALISDELWSRRFGRSAAVIGTTVRAFSTDRPRDNPLVTIVGVLPSEFWRVNRFTNVLRPLSGTRLPSLAQLRPGMSAEDAQRRLTAGVRAQLGAVDPAWHMTVVDAREEHTLLVRPILHALLAAALFMLLVSCASVSGALVARTAARRGELGVRAALGASRRRLLAQLLIESAMLSSIAAIVGVVAGRAILLSLGSAIETHLQTTVPGGIGRLAPPPLVLAVAIGVSTLTGVLCGLLPALTALGRDLRVALATLVSGSRSGSLQGANRRLRRVLISAQLAMATVLLFGAGLMVRTIARLDRLELGFAPEGVVKANVLLPSTRYPDSASRLAVVTRVLERVRATPGVRDAAVVFPYPFRGVMPSPVILEGTMQSSATPTAIVRTATPRLFEVTGIRLLSGRAIDDRDAPSSPLVAVVSETLARRLRPDGAVIGLRIRVGEDSLTPRTIVGVTADTRTSLTGQQLPDVYVPYAQNPRAYHTILARIDGDPRAIATALQRAVAGVDEVLALSDLEPLADVVQREGAQRRGLTILLVTFSTFALGLAALGLYASLAYMVLQRRSELAIRMAIGADAAEIMRLVLREGMSVTAAGLLAGIGLSLLAGRVLASQLYAVSATDPLTLAAIATTLGATALAAIAIPARRAADLDPASVLKG